MALRLEESGSRRHQCPARETLVLGQPILSCYNLSMGSDKAVHVLVVDDEEGMRHMLELMLGQSGFEVSLAANGLEAIQQLGSRAVDVVLADVHMPELDGIGLLQRIEEAQIPTTVLMMSAYVELDTAITAMKMGAADYVSKPFKSEEVLLKIRMALERQHLREESERLAAENARLRGESADDNEHPPSIIGKSNALSGIITTLRKIADYKSTVLITGESGTGKEVLARALHDISNRSGKPFIPINCGAIPETLLESELFGHVRGAFTDATRDKKGLVEEAHEGTLFLDEIGELPLALQVKLLRFLQEDEIRPVGENQGRKVDVRIAAATARDLGDMVSEGTFREDLFYRLNVLQLNVPPLRDRKEDIPLLVEHFINKFGAKMNQPDMSISRDALKALMDYSWRGNIRELENTIERAMVLSETQRIGTDSLPDKMRRIPERPKLDFLGDDLSIKKATRAIEKELITRGLKETGGNRTKAAKLLEISHRALLYKIKEYGLN